MDRLPSARLRAGDRFDARTLVAIDGTRVDVPDPAYAFVHLQLRRYAGCPICSLHLRTLALRHDAIAAAGVREVAVFHSSAEELRKVHVALPFAVVPDPARAIYDALGVATSPLALLDPRAWPAALRGVATGASRSPTAGWADGSFGFPADFLIARDGRLAAVKYGAHADDQWSVDEILAHAGAR